MNSRGIFLLDPANAKFHQNRARWPARPGWGELALMIVLASAGMVPAWLSYDEWREINRLETADSGQAEVVRARVDSSAEDASYHLEYRLILPGGVTLQHEQEVSRTDYSRLSTRRTVDVLYNTAGESRIRDTEPLRGIYGVLFSALWIGIIGGGVVSLMRRRNRAHRLAAAPRVPGWIREVSGTLDDGTYTVEVVYEVQSPRTRRVLTGKQSATRADLKDAPLPQRGAEVLVLFGGDDDHLLL